jgi:hypothetical protein
MPLCTGAVEMRFRVRSPVRDQSADAARISSIERSISEAIADANAERNGLARRLDAARARASILVGTDTSDYETRDPKNERLLQEAEDDLVVGQKRVNQLTAHIEHMGRMLDFLKQK